MVKKHSKIVKARFDKEYETYDQEVRDVLPFYEEMHKQVINAVDFDTISELTILDLGIGTGQTALDLLKRFSKAKITGVDLSPKMFTVAKNRLKAQSHKVEFVVGDIIDFLPQQKYDVCVAVLSIHHLNQKEKQSLFGRIYNALSDEGIFVIGDLIIGDSLEETNQLERQWKDHLTRKFGRKAAEKWMKIYKKEDIPDSITNQLQWLKNLGFKEVKCIWKKLNCAVFLGKK